MQIKNNGYFGKDGTDMTIHDVLETVKKRNMKLKTIFLLTLDKVGVAPAAVRHLQSLIKISIFPLN
ncbi:hypothetical protein AAULH_11886 [Lactobacillus helveticus MTCC 5463]|nr:hypothetical protein AAULH_11886 [Lactobacillus helveticus MTCC 5463]